MSKNTTKITLEDKSEFLDFLWTYNDSFGYFNNKGRLKDTNRGRNVGQPQLLVYMTDTFDPTVFDPVDHICLKIEPTITLAKVLDIKSDCHYNVEGDIEYGFYEGDVSASVELSLQPYKLFQSLKQRGLLAGREVKEHPHKELYLPVKVVKKIKKAP